MRNEACWVSLSPKPSWRKTDSQRLTDDTRRFGLSSCLNTDDESAASRNARTSRRRSEARVHNRPMRRVNDWLGTASLASDNPSGQGGAQSGTSETPNPRSTRTAIASSPSSSNRSRVLNSCLAQIPVAKSRPPQSLWVVANGTGSVAKAVCGSTKDFLAVLNNNQGLVPEHTPVTVIWEL